jgi:hypothetical protein
MHLQICSLRISAFMIGAGYVLPILCVNVQSPTTPFCLPPLLRPLYPVLPFVWRVACGGMVPVILGGAAELLLDVRRADIAHNVSVARAQVWQSSHCWLVCLFVVACALLLVLLCGSLLRGVVIVVCYVMLC